MKIIGLASGVNWGFVKSMVVNIALGGLNYAFFALELISVLYLISHVAPGFIDDSNFHRLVAIGGIIHDRSGVDWIISFSLAAPFSMLAKFIYSVYVNRERGV